MEAKLQLYRAMLKRGVRKAHLARRLDMHAPQIDRLLNLSHDSRLDQIESAARILDLRLQIKLVNAA
jgi:antitoxin HicB